MAASLSVFLQSRAELFKSPHEPSAGRGGGTEMDALLLLETNLMFPGRGGSKSTLLSLESHLGRALLLGLKDFVSCSQVSCAFLT